MPRIELKYPNIGGISDSKYLGIENSFAELVGLDIHGEPGIIKVNQALTKESGTTVDAMVNAIVPCSDGSTYMFGANGKIWKRTSAGTYSLERTISGGPAILDAKEYSGYIYYATGTYLGRCAVGAAWSTAADTWATFANADTGYHPMYELNLILYIGDGKYVAQVDNQAGTHIFTNNALDIQAPLRVQSLGAISTDLLIGTYINNNVQKTHIIRWNTWSVSFTSADPIPEVGINAFLATDNYVLVQAGRKGNIYQYGNDVLEQMKRIPGDWSGAKRGVVYLNAVANILGIPVFGFSNLNANPASQGVYSFGKTGSQYPMILNLEYIISTTHSASITISAMTFLTGGTTDSDVLLVAWKDDTTYGVDKLDVTAKHPGAYLSSRTVVLNREDQQRIADIFVPYRSLPTNTSIQIWVNKNNTGSFVQITDTEVDTINCFVHCTVGVEGVSKFQVRVIPVPSANTAPEIESVIILTT